MIKNISLYFAFSLTAIFLLPLNNLSSQINPRYEISKLTDKMYVLSLDAGGYPDKVVASVGEDGLLIVDSGDKENGEQLKEALNTLNKGLPKVIINTHSHIEHVGGNISVGDSAVIIGHSKMRDRYLNGLYMFLNVPERYLPAITFEDSLSIYFNGEEIKLISYAGAHDNSDIIVWFTKSNVACTAALCANHHFPSIDNENGDIEKYIPTVEKLIDRLPTDVKLVPGHSENCTITELKQFRDMLVSTSRIIISALQNGESLQSIIERDILAEWTPYESYATKDYLIQLWANAYSSPKVLPIRAQIPKPYKLIFDLINTDGAAEAIARYRNLKKENSFKYNCDDRMLLYIGNMMWMQQRNEDAILFYNACTEEIPGSIEASKCYGRLGAIYRSINKPELAKECYSKYLQKFPFDKRVAQIVSEL
ncbi:MAG: MBL fold metallo-hydrolase [bacterium]